MQVVVEPLLCQDSASLSSMAPVPLVVTMVDSITSASQSPSPLASPSPSPSLSPSPSPLVPCTMQIAPMITMWPINLPELNTMQVGLACMHTTEPPTRDGHVAFPKTVRACLASQFGLNLTNTGDNVMGLAGATLTLHIAPLMDYVGQLTPLCYGGMVEGWELFKDCEDVEVEYIEVRNSCGKLLLGTRA